MLVRRDANRPDRLLVIRQDRQRAAGDEVPQADRRVHRPCYDLRLERLRLQADDRLLVAGQRVHVVLRADVPHARRAVAAARHEEV